MKQVFDTNPDLVESLSHIIAERRQAPGRQRGSWVTPTKTHPPVLLSAIKRFFGLS